MKTKTTFKSLLVITGLLLTFNLQAQEATPVIQHVETAGTLPTLIAEDEKYQITDLILTGNLNGTDMRYIREMAGRDVNGYATSGKLTILNLAGANIVSGGEYYYNNNIPFYTSDSTIGGMAFYACVNLTSVTIPNSVTTIGAYAFLMCNGLISVTIGNSVNTIEEGAFDILSSGFTEIHTKNPTPPVVYPEYTFDGINKTTCKLYVPTGSADAYRKAAVWSDFLNIIEENTTAINTISDGTVAIHSTISGIAIATQEAASVVIFNLAGQQVYQAFIHGSSEIALNKGVYIVRVGNESQKVIVK